MKQIVFKKGFFILALLGSFLFRVSAQKVLPLIQVASNKHFFQTSDGKPFFWLGDTGWLLFVKMNRDEIVQYLDNRKAKGFNLIQVMVVHDLKKAVNVYGDSAFANRDLAKPITTAGNDFKNASAYDFWDHLEFAIQEASKRGIYLAMVPVWGSNVKEGMVSLSSAQSFAQFLVKRFGQHNNLVWLNGGDLRGSEKTEIWNAIGNMLKANDQKHLVGFHPRGRSTSSEWFHQSSWLDFNMFQSGHKDYAQDTVEPRMGEDSWKFMQNDYALQPTKPSFDGEPSYEMIPHGLHDTTAPKWQAADLRRYAYWSVFAGGAGFTYGHNAVMQFHNGQGIGDYGTKQNWKDAINDPGAGQMQWMKKLVLSKSYFDRVPDQSLIASKQGERYERVVACRGKDYVFAYTYTGRAFDIQMGKIQGLQVKASWYNPRNGTTQLIGQFNNKGIQQFQPTGTVQNGNDWVLVLESIKDK